MPTEHKVPDVSPDPAHPGSERHADESRPGGPRYHGDAWETADEDEGEEPSFDDEAPPAPKKP
jgi:hypothetical protein